MKKVLFVGVPKGKKCHDKALCVDITDVFVEMVDVIGDISKVAMIIGEHKSFKNYRPSRIFIDCEQQEAIEEFVNLYGRETHLSVIK